MLGQSVVLTLLGMCVVFGFLIIMIACMNLLRIIVHAAKLDVEAPKADGIAAPAAGADAAPASSTSTAYVVPFTVMLYFFISIVSFL